MLYFKKKHFKKLLNGTGKKNIKKILDHLLARGQPQVFDEKDFVIYTSGEIGNYYVQTADTLASGKIQKIVAIELARMILKDWTGDYRSLILSGGESRDIPYSSAVQTILELPQLMMYKYLKGEQATSKAIGATDIKGKDVVHVADLNNMGSSVRDMWMPKIQHLKGNLRNVYFVVDRHEDGVQVVKDLGIESRALINFDEKMWKYALKKEYITSSQFDSILERLQDKKAWALRVLEENPQRIKELNKKNPERVKKMIAAYDGHMELFACIDE